VNYGLIFKPSAEKDFARLSKQLKKRILLRLEDLRGNPRLSGSIKLKGSTSAYRLRVGDYRIVYEIDDAARQIFVTIIAHRRDVYRGI
jgi:mRNA interferase RelE/StbE